jgi:hypothetical protein
MYSLCYVFLYVSFYVGNNIYLFLSSELTSYKIFLLAYIHYISPFLFPTYIVEEGHVMVFLIFFSLLDAYFKW